MHRMAAKAIYGLLEEVGRRRQSYFVVVFYTTDILSSMYLPSYMLEKHYLSSTNYVCY